MRVIIVGGGETAFFLARTYLNKGYQVSVINKNRDECEHLSRRLKVLVINGDGTDPNILDDAGAKQANTIIAVTPFDHINLVCCQTGTHLFKIPQTLALVNDPNNCEIFYKLGVQRVFSQTEIVVSILEKDIDYDYVDHLLSYAHDKALLNEILIDEKMPSVGVKLSDLELPKNSKIVGLTREKKFEFAVGDSTIQPGDRILLLTTPEVHGKTLRVICGAEC